MVKMTQNSFLGGQLDFEMMGRQDYAKYRKGASVLKNFNILKRGGITKRQGFDKIIDLNETLGIPNDSKLRIVPFAYKKDHGFVLLFAGSTETYDGGCWAVYTMKNCVYNAWSVLPSNDVSFFKNDEIGEFDYAQSGYKLFIAHQSHAPSDIWTNEQLVDASIEDPSKGSPFTWEKFDISGIDDAIPSITGAVQNRIAPGEDSASGTYIEKYKVSSVFDDVETKPCSEFYNESCIEPVSITSTSGGTCIQRSSSTTAAYNNITYSKDTTTVTSHTYVPAVTNTSSVYTNKVSSSCAGTKYYLPWVESQSIKLTISAQKKGGVYPDTINVYKKASGYYGLAGTIRVSESGSSGDINCSIGFSGAVQTYDWEKVSTDSNARMLESTTSANVKTTFTDDYSSNMTGYSLATGASFTLTPKYEISENAHVKLYLGKPNITFTKWNLQNYTRPLAASFDFIESTTTSVVVTADIEYTNTNEELVEVTLSGTATVPATGSYASGSFSATSSSTFAKQYKNNFISWISGYTYTPTVSISVHDAIKDLLPTDIKEGSIFALKSVSVAPENGVLVVYGVAFSTSKIMMFEFTDNNITPDTSITPISSDFEAPFSKTGDYPATVCVYQQRLVWASSINDPETVWMSAVGDFYDYSEHEIQSDSDAIEFSMPVTRFAKLNHIVEMKRLLAFNSACEWLIDSSSSQKGITYETIRAMPQSYSGSNSRMKPLICNNSVVFSERTGQAVRRFAYNIQDDGFAGRDVSILASSIFERNTIVDWTYQQHPFSTIWCVLSDGTLATLEIMEEQDIIAWATHVHGDPDARFTNVATSYAMSPSLADIESNTDEPYELATSEEIFAIVEHGSGDSLTRTLERMRVRSKATDTIYNSLCLDSTEVVTESTELKSGQVGVNATTGEITTSGTVDAGTIVGYTFEAKFTSVFPSIGEQYVGGGQFAIKNLNNLHLRLEASDGGKVAATRIENEAMPIRYDDDAGNDKTSVKKDGVATFYNCDAANCHPVGCNNRDGRITITQDTPWPFTLLSYEAEYATEHENYVPRVR